VRVNNDDFVKNPISALRFIPLSLRRTARTPHSTGFARLELGLFTKPSVIMTFDESINNSFRLKAGRFPPSECGPNFAYRQSFSKREAPGGRGCVLAATPLEC
jgi:hypothetical protein